MGEIQIYAHFVWRGGKNASALAYAQGGLQEDPEFVEQVLLLGFRDVDVRKASTKRSQKAILKSVGDQKAALKFDY